MGATLLLGSFWVSCECKHHYFITFFGLNHFSHGPLVKLKTQLPGLGLIFIMGKRLHSSATGVA
ncbi:hypothetical protein, partial [Enterococcus faecalis]|uniref:hypothetical protein n=1 Tax=Enterococcus faecalis TaxID=1351 RepID=UPI0039883277